MKKHALSAQRRPALAARLLAAVALAAFSPSLAPSGDGPPAPPWLEPLHGLRADRDGLTLRVPSGGRTDKSSFALEVDPPSPGGRGLAQDLPTLRVVRVREDNGDAHFIDGVELAWAWDEIAGLGPDQLFLVANEFVPSDAEGAFDLDANDGRRGRGWGGERPAPPGPDPLFGLRLARDGVQAIVYTGGCTRSEDFVIQKSAPESDGDGDDGADAPPELLIERTRIDPCRALGAFELPRRWEELGFADSHLRERRAFRVANAFRSFPSLAPPPSR